MSIDKDTKFSYKIIDEDNLENSNNNFLIEFEWGENYPEEIPIINLDSFFNVHLTDKTKDTILEKLNEEAENNIGKNFIKSQIRFIQIQDSLGSKTQKILGNF